MSISEYMNSCKSENKFSTDNFYIGVPEAEAEATRKSGLTLNDFYEDYLGINTEIDRGKFLLIGRKGSGKSAFAEFLRILSEKENNSSLHVNILRRNVRSVNLAIHNASQCSNGANLIWQWMILLAIVKELISLRHIFTSEKIEALDNFYSYNSGFIPINNFDLNQETKKVEKEINLNPLKEIIKIFGKKDVTLSGKRPQFFKVIESLQSVVVDCLKEIEQYQNDFFIIIDDLDIEYSSASEYDCIFISELIRVAKEMNSTFFKYNVNILVLIRDDILNDLNSKNADMNKIIESYGVKLIWYEYKMFRNNIENMPLLKLINKRLKKNLEAIGYPTQNPWKTVFEDDDYDFFKQIIDITYARPRDIIQCLMNINNIKSNFPIKKDKFVYFIKNYTNTIHSEIKNEFSNFLSRDEIEIVFKSLKNLIQNKHNNGISRREIEQELIKLKYKGNVKDVINLLFDRSIIGHISKNNHLKFKYRNPDINVDDHNIFTVHKSLYEYINTR